jgi:hypothetical protein
MARLDLSRIEWQCLDQSLFESPRTDDIPAARRSAAPAKVDDRLSMDSAQPICFQ